MTTQLALAPPPASTPVFDSKWRWLAQGACRALWFFAVPALLSAVYVRYGVPSAAGVRSELGRALVRLAHDQLVPLGVGSFLLFTWLFRYWRLHLPGARWLSTAGDFARFARNPRQWSLLERKLSAESLRELATVLQRLEAEIDRNDIATAARTERAARALAAPALRAREWSHALQAVAAAVFAAMFALLIREHALAPVRVLSGSMLPNLTPGDLLLADRTAYRTRLSGVAPGGDEKMPRRGDIVVFTPPEGEETSEPLVKRVIGIPGDRIAMRGSRPVINGWEVPACDAGHYLYVLPDGAVSARLWVEFMDDRAYLTVAAPALRQFPEPYEVKAGEVFVLGDNRNNSSDSRAWNEGHGAGAKLDAIVGRVRWFLLGARRDQHFDLSRLLGDADSARLHLEGIDVTVLQESIAKCLAEWPKDTHVPADAPNAPSVVVPPIPLRGE